MEEGLKLFEWLIAPQSVDEFFADVWEQKHLVIKRNDPGYYSGIFTKEGILLLYFLLFFISTHCSPYY